MLLKDMLIPSEITYSSFCCRYTYNMLARMGIHYLPLTWLNFSLCILLYPLSVLAKGKEMGWGTNHTFIYLLQ